jgi:hypothetical protein
VSGIAPAMLETMSQTQILASGLVIRQDFAAAVRPVFFQTEFEEFLYATHGGTLFLVSFRGKTYGLTCRHVFQDFALEQLFIAQEKQARKGSKPAPIKGICYPSAPVDGAVGTDRQPLPDTFLRYVRHYVLAGGNQPPRNERLLHEKSDGAGAAAQRRGLTALDVRYYSIRKSIVTIRMLQSISEARRLLSLVVRR